MSFTAIIAVSRFIGSLADSGTVATTGIRAEKEVILAFKTEVEVEGFGLDIETKVVARE